MKMTTNIICLRVIIFLLILPFEVQCQRNPVYSCPIGKNSDCTVSRPSEFNCSDPQGLPCDEAYALIDVINGLKLPDSQPTDFSRKNCDDFATESISISCSCNTTCHVTGISTTPYVDLSDGIIHENVSKLLYLEKLVLSYNHLRGIIPDSLGNLTALRILGLNNNYLRGAIPSSLGNLATLEKLHLYNNFLWGSIPPSLGNLASLKSLYLSHNNLSGEIPKELGKLSKLSTMILEENELEGDLPWQLGNLNNLIRLFVGYNYLNGVLPDEFRKLSSIQQFSVGGNSFRGQIPEFISKWNDLTYLDLTGNDFEGNHSLFLKFFEMSNLKTLWVSDLKSTQDFSFPNKMNMKNIEQLGLVNCHINGSIPDVIGNWPNIYYLDLSFNKLSGPIPDALQNVSATILLTENMLSGQIPPWLNEKTDLSYNYIEIPQNNSNYTTADPNIWPNRNYTNNETKGQCDSLNQNLFINCGGGKLTDEDKEYDEDTSREKFYVSPNKKWGYTCSGMFQTSKEEFNSSIYIKNKTCGVSDAGLQETARLCPISLTYYGFCLENGNYSVKLQFAELVFANEEDYSSLKKRIFDVYIQGEKKLENFNIKNETEGKPYIANNQEFVANVQDNQLVIKFYWAGKGTPLLNGPLVSAISVSPNFTNSSGEKKLSAGEITGITVGSVLAPILLLLLLWKMGCLRNREFQKVLIDVKGKNFTLQQIIDATRNFSPDMEIGKGRFGTVYKAELPNQIVLAVKKISPDLMQDKLRTELKNEIYNLKSLKQENLIELFGGYSKKELHLLIYEYMEKGSLQQAVLDPNPANVPLDWKVRFDVCLGLAKALKYLHEKPRDTILHRNIKASNILLDGSYIPKLSDFGSAMPYNEEDPFMTIKAGTARVYIAPEYARGQPITVKADVYSYGVVVLEVFSGRPCIQYKTNDETAYLLDDGITAHAQNRMYTLVDGKMVNYDRKVVLNTLNLAIMCINQAANLRPTMSEVVSVLLGENTIGQITKAHIS